jgi:hypothetical protein
MAGHIKFIDEKQAHVAKELASLNALSLGQMTEMQVDQKKFYEEAVIKWKNYRAQIESDFNLIRQKMKAIPGHDPTKLPDIYTNETKVLGRAAKGTGTDIPRYSYLRPYI